LPVQRQMQAELAEHNLGQELRSGTAPVDRMERGRLLGDRIAGAAGEALAHMLDHAPACRNALQCLGHVLAELAQGRAAAAGAGRGSGMHDPMTRKMVRQGTASRLLAGKGLDRDRRVSRRRGLGSGFLQVFEPEFQLLDARAALRRWSEPLPPQPGDLELQPFDLDAERQPRSRSRRLGRTPRLALRQDHRMGGGKIGEQRLRRVGHLPRESQSQTAVTASRQPTALGRQLSRGMRQSIPDSR
jgi:hypothetical protein